MVQTDWRQPPLTKEQSDRLFLLMLDDDTEDAPWMTMGDLQFWSASSFAHSLRSYARRQRLPWYVASMLPIIYDVPGASRRKVLSPDTFVAFVPDHPRSSFDVAAEGGVFPPFVLEVVSPSSVEYDQSEKRHAYDALGAREYALFTPREDAPSTLEGYRRDEHNQFVPWLPDEQGRLWSEVLGLYLIVRGTLLQAQTPGGQLLLTLDQAEEEVERLRRELERYRDRGDR
ncbi:MAG: Uma2 family endonuclease [Thermomicrobiales bacterium]